MGPDKPIVQDVRPEGHNSLGTLPRLGADDWQVLRDFYKLIWRTNYGYDAAKVGQLYVGLYGVELKAGPAILQPRFYNLQGQPAGGGLLWNYWSGAEVLPQDATPKYYLKGVHCFTDASGSCGWAYGGGSHVGPDGGPHCVWVNAGGAGDNFVGSDALDRIGWWDDHITPNPIFRVMRKGGSVEPGDDAWLVDIDNEGNVIKRIRWEEGPFDPGAGDYGALGVMDKGGNIVYHVKWETPLVEG